MLVRVKIYPGKEHMAALNKNGPDDVTSSENNHRSHSITGFRLLEMVLLVFKWQMLGDIRTWEGSLNVRSPTVFSNRTALKTRGASNRTIEGTFSRDLAYSAHRLLHQNLAALGIEPRIPFTLYLIGCTWCCVYRQCSA